MDVVVVIIVSAVLGLIWSAWRRGGDTGPRVAWKETVHISLPPAIARREVVRYLTARGCTFVNSEGECDAFRRGEYVRRLRGPGDAPWLTLPVIIVAVCAEEDGRPLLHMHFSLLPIVSASASGFRYFQEQARAEFAEVVGYLEQVAREQSQRRGGQKRRRRPNHRWYPGDEEGQREQESPASAHALDADLALLGLKRGASLEQVQKAYRIACRKYHPDRLTGQNVEPHLVELAVQRFKDVAAAYQRLRESYAQAQSA